MSNGENASNQLQTEIDTTLALTSGTPINICYALLRIIENGAQQDQPGLLQHASEHFDEIETSKEIKIDSFITENEKDHLKSRYGDLVNEMLAFVLKENQPEKDFYVSLWQVLHNPVFHDEKARAFALYYVLIDRRIPYFRLDQGLKMSDEDWEAVARRLRRKRAKIRFILATSFSQRSEEADLLLKELDAVTGPERVSLMGFLLWELRGKENVKERLRGLSKLLP